MEIEILIDERQVTEALSRLVKIGRNMRPIMREVAGVMEDGVEDAFSKQSDPTTGMPWASLKPATIRQRKRKGKWPGKILQVSAAGLASSIQSQYGDDYAIAGTNKEYAAIHQFGGTIDVHARSQQVYFRQNKRTGQVGNRFVPKSRSNFAQWATMGAHSITIPARPFLGLSPHYTDEVLGVFAAHIRRALR